MFKSARFDHEPNPHYHRNRGYQVSVTLPIGQWIKKTQKYVLKNLKNYRALWLAREIASFAQDTIKHEHYKQQQQ